MQGATNKVGRIAAHTALSHHTQSQALPCLASARHTTASALRSLPVARRAAVLIVVASGLLRSRPPSWQLFPEQKAMEMGVIIGEQLARKLARRNAQCTRPCLHAFRGHAPKAIFDLRDERIVLEAQARREIQLR